MRERLNFWVVGGDPRQATLARALSGDGHTVHTYALERGIDAALWADSLSGISVADCVILPLPAADGDYLNTPLSDRRVALSELLEALRPGQLLCAGRVSPTLQADAQARKLHLVDYFAREELAVANAVPGALAV